TVGDIESTPFLETIRQICLEQPKEDCMCIHVTLVPHLQGSDELKTKPTQHSVRTLQSLGVHPDMIVVRCDKEIDDQIKEKISLFCNVSKESVIYNGTLPILYEVPLMLEAQNMCTLTLERLNLPLHPVDLTEWTSMIDKIKSRNETVTISLVGKYTSLHDAYCSVVESLYHGGYQHHSHIHINWVDSEVLTEENIENILGQTHGILVPGGFGERGIEGMILAAKFAREKNIPYLGICLGMQIACIEFARNVLGYAQATSKEFDEHTPHPIIHIMEDQKYIQKMGGTLRKGSYPCKLKENSVAKASYQADVINERHRHRYEFNNSYRPEFEQGGLDIVGTSLDDLLVEVVENKNCDYFVGCQYHPEFKSRPNRPHPLFASFIQHALAYKNK
ncbi:MAG: CTP synthase, partial [Erysipelotrichaceae bacterium]